MKKQVISLVTILAVAGSLGAVAQIGPVLRVDIAFGFIAGAKALPAGEYTFKATNEDREVTIRNAKSGETILVPVLTRLGPRSGTDAEAVFDVAEGQHYLAELHLPGVDGFAFKAAPGKHTHVGVKAKK